MNIHRRTSTGLTCPTEFLPTTGHFCGADGTGSSAMTLTLTGSGHAQLTFGNGGVNGVVTVDLAGSVLGTASANQVLTVSFDYTNGQVLTISEDTARIFLPADSLVCGAEPCDTVSAAAINDFANIANTNWDITNVYVPH